MTWKKSNLKSTITCLMPPTKLSLWRPTIRKPTKWSTKNSKTPPNKFTSRSKFTPTNTPVSHLSRTPIKATKSIPKTIPTKPKSYQHRSLSRKIKTKMSMWLKRLPNQFKFRIKKTFTPSLIPKTIKNRSKLRTTKTCIILPSHQDPKLIKTTESKQILPYYANPEDNSLQ